jgi:RIO kinase 1
MKEKENKTMNNVQEWIDYFEENDLDEEALHAVGVRNVDTRKRKQAAEARVVKTSQDDVKASASIMDAIEGGFNITYQPSRHEAGWLLNALGGFFLDQWFDDILRIVKGGKEASVYLCKAHPSVGIPYLAAKVYRPRQFRNLRKDHIYREGRDVLDGDGQAIHKDREVRAILHKTGYGKQLMHTSWIDYEVQAMRKLHEAGADVPMLFESGNMALIMEYIGDETMAAPTLHEVNLDGTEARYLFERTIHNVELMLANGIVHGDLSAYNILYWDGRITLIDFPQMVLPATNRNAFPIFRRDVQRVCDYFSHQGVQTDAGRLVEQIWNAHAYPKVHELPSYMLQDDENDEEEGDFGEWNEND